MVVKECPFCHPTAGKVDNQWKLYILNRNGCYKCFRCQSQGSWFDFQSKIRGHNGSSISVTPVMKSQTPASAPAVPAVLPAAGTAEEQVALLHQSKQAMEYLTKERALSEETLTKYGVGLSKLSFDSGPEWCLSFPWFDSGDTMVRYKARALSSKGKQRLVPKGGGWSLFGLNTVGEETTEVVLTEGEFDAMAVHQATGMAAISLPNGAGSLPVEVLPMLERFSKIYLWMDHDSVGIEAVPKFVKKLGMGRTCVVSGVTKDQDGKQKMYKDANDALRDGADLSAMINESRPEPHDQIVNFNMLRNELYQNMMFPERHAGRKSRSLPKLDAILKGHRRGEMTVVTGPTGSGKTTFLSQLSLDYCEQQVPTLWASFEILNTRLAQKMLAQHSKKLGKKGEGLPLTLENFPEIADSFEQLPLHFLRFHGSSDVDEVLEAMDYACYAHDVEHVVLDNLQFMLSGQGRGYDRFEQQDRAIEKFRKFATQKNVHVTLVIHPRKEQDGEPLGITSVFGGAKATQEADNIVVIQHLAKQGPDGATVNLKYVEVKKNRYDGQLGRVYLKFLPAYASFVEETKIGNIKV
eukprot:TRINITY_DN50532_c0_g1_i1.p1 TRINITY_DN50532_c0_g1~~TRINITY_DN50532_c0_g1_i1.p1  ORF type:complete len:579 (+),score=141.24 TRINITY_DN50532_c0_g1_i1:307-2043(+)